MIIRCFEICPKVHGQVPDQSRGRPPSICVVKAVWNWAACSTHFWVDRTAGVCASLYGNFLPFVSPQALALYNDFERAHYASL